MTEAKIDALIIKTDGAARGNPGPAGIGALVYSEKGDLLRAEKEYIGEATNNIAEYRALLLGLATAANYRPRAVKLYLDSELVVRQLQGVYKVKNDGLKPLHLAALTALSKYQRFDIVHIPRSRNQDADKLANEAIDESESAGPDEQKPAVLPGQGSLF